MPGAPFAKAGIRKDDVILTINGQSVDQIASLMGVTAALKPGTTAEIGALRAQKTGTIRLPVTADLSNAIRRSGPTPAERLREHSNDQQRGNECELQERSHSESELSIS